MDQDERDTICPENLLGEALAAAGGDDQAGLERVEVLARTYPHDPRLHFLRGSMLAGLKRYEAAIGAIGQALALAPGYAVARFQLGFLYFTSGDAAAAAMVWRPLSELPEDEPLRLFAEGLEHLARDDWDSATGRLERGMALNTANPPMNADMRLILAELAATRADPAGSEPMSDAHRLLQRYDLPGTKH